MNSALKRKRGAPFGNQNARKHGFYSRVLTATDKRHLKKAALISGMDEEIDLLRVKLRAVLQRDPENVRLILQAVVSLGRLLRTRQYLAKTDDNRLFSAIENVYADIAAPLGLDTVKLITSKCQNLRTLK